MLLVTQSKPSFTCIAAALLTIVAAQEPGDFIKVNVGGPELSEIGFLADEEKFFAEGSGASNTFKGPSTPITPLSWDDVYRTHRYALGGNLSYCFPVPDGVFNVSLMFTEQYDGVAWEGGRIFNIYVNNMKFYSGVDVWTLAGGKLYQPVFLKKHGIYPVDGNISITLTPVVQNPMLSGIVIEGPNATSMLWKMTYPQAVDSASGKWTNVQYKSGFPVARHEACAVFAQGRVYNIGGRGVKPVSVYDPITGVWEQRSGPPVEIHHMQCIYYMNRIYLGGGWYGAFPFEKEHSVMYAYDIPTGTWLILAGLPEGRRRGGAAFVLFNDKMYLSHGAMGGHGSQAMTTGYLDEYDPVRNTWTALPDSPFPRDHTAGSVINDKLCVAGGRDGGKVDFWNANVAEIVCYKFESRQWEVRASLPVPRSSVMVGTTCQGLLMVAGGEGKTTANQAGQAFDRVDLYDDTTNSFSEPTFMTTPRHGTGLAITSCQCSNIYVPSGSSGLGGSSEEITTDVWSVDGNNHRCI